MASGGIIVGVTEKLLKDFAILLATIDPVSTLVLFVAVTAGRSKAERRRIAGKAVLVSAAILLGFLALGQIVMGSMDIALNSFQIAGSCFLLFFGFQLTFGSPEEAFKQGPEAGRDVAVFPLALPSIASPGALTAVVVLTDNDVYSVKEQALTALLMVGILFVTWLLLLAAEPIHRFIGDGGAAAIVRILGILLASLATEMLLAALRHAGILAPLAKAAAAAVDP